jgi:hypothetical protein
MGAAGTMLSNSPMERSVGNEDGAVQDQAAGRHTVAGELVGACTPMKHGYWSRRPHAKIRVVARVAGRQQEGVPTS